MLSDTFIAPYGEEWKKKKKLVLSTLKTFDFGNRTLEEKINDQIEQFEDFVMKCKGSAVDISRKIRILRTGAISSIVFGGNASWDDPNITKLVKMVDTWIKDLSAAFTRPYRSVNQTFSRILGLKTMDNFPISIGPDCNMFRDV